MIIKYFDNKGKEIEKGYEVSNTIFGAKVNEALLTQYVFAFQSNQRQANAQTKDRGEVSGGGKKPWRQKGTGRARVGSIRSPLWKGGGVTFGPLNNRNYKKDLTKKMVKAAFRSAFSLAAKNSQVAVMEKLDVTEIDTKAVLKSLDKALRNGKLLLVQNGSNKELMMSVRNVPNLKLINIQELNPFDVLNAKQILILEDAVAYINEKWEGKKKSAAKVIAIKSEEKSEKKVVKKTVAKKATSKKVK